jgi:hypothetical protein
VSGPQLHHMAEAIEQGSQKIFGVLSGLSGEDNATFSKADLVLVREGDFHLVTFRRHFAVLHTISNVLAFGPTNPYWMCKTCHRTVAHIWPTHHNMAPAHVRWQFEKIPGSEDGVTLEEWLGYIKVCFPPRCSS